MSPLAFYLGLAQGIKPDKTKAFSASRSHSCCEANATPGETHYSTPAPSPLHNHPAHRQWSSQKPKAHLPDFREVLLGWEL